VEHRQRPKSDGLGSISGVGALTARENPKPRLAAKVWGLEGVKGVGDREISRIAERQRGLVHRHQLLEAGISPNGIRHRLETARLHSLYRDVYLVGRPHLEPLAAATAAVMHFRGHAVLSHRTAGQLWGLVDGQEVPVTVSTRGADARSRPGLIVHRLRTLDERQLRQRHGLPVTSPARTLLDLAGVLDPHELEAAYAIARRAGLATPREIAAATRRASRSKGIATLRELLRAETAGPRSGPPQTSLTRSTYERKLLRLIRDAQLPGPLANATVEGIEVDLLWPAQRLVVEFDGFAFHSGRDAFERDRARDQRLIAAGYRVIRVTARQLDHSPLALIAVLAMALARR
jgi:very-short-patch-repair endonuclease